MGRLGSYLFLALLCLTPPAGLALAQDIGEDVLKRGVINEDLYLAGGRIRVTADVDGDVIAAGGRVAIDNRVSGDILAAGGSINIGGHVLDDVRAAGGQILLDGRVDGDTLAAGGSVILAPGAVVGERAWLGGGDVEIAGRVGGELRAAGATIILSGVIDGDVRAAANTIKVLPGARISGDFIYHSPHEAVIDNQAQITGSVTRLPMPHPPGPGIAHVAAMGIVFLMSLTVAAVVLYLLFPYFSVASARTLAARPWAGLGLGLAALVTTPFAAALLTATVVGGVLGLLLFALYGLLLFAGFVTGVLCTGDSTLRRLGRDTTRGRHVLVMIGIIFAIGLLQLVPVLGALIAFLVLVFGTGGLLLAIYQAYHGRRVAT